MKKTLELHKKYRGKIEMHSKVNVRNKEDLSIYYSPGVADPCLAIKENPDTITDYTNIGNTIAIISDGSAVLGLGNIGAKASLPVMEGKALLFKKFGNVDAIPILLNTQDTNKIIETIKNIAISFGGINLEDIAAPRCVEIETKLQKILDIPVFHDDQHGTAIVMGAALINAMRLTKKNDPKDLKVVLSGTGAAGYNIAKTLNKLGFTNIYAYNTLGVVSTYNIDKQNHLVKELIANKIIALSKYKDRSIKKIMNKADIFIGVSVPNIITSDDVKTMNKNPWIFALANPNPEIMPEDATNAGAYIIGTGRSDYNNQINNLLAFPIIFRIALDLKLKKISDKLKMLVIKAIADVIPFKKLSKNYIIPNVFEKNIFPKIIRQVKEQYIKD